MKVYLVLEHRHDSEYDVDYEEPTKIFDTREKAEAYINDTGVLAFIYEMEVESSYYAGPRN